MVNSIRNLESLDKVDVYNIVLQMSFIELCSLLQHFLVFYVIYSSNFTLPVSCILFYTLYFLILLYIIT